MTGAIMKDTSGSKLSPNASAAAAGQARYTITICFIGKSNANMRLDSFDAIKKLGTFNIQNEKNHVYTLDFSSELNKSGLEERLKEISGPAKLFNYGVEDVLKS